jgi:hypothetical protein
VGTHQKIHGTEGTGTFVFFSKIVQFLIGLFPALAYKYELD